MLHLYYISKISLPEVWKIQKISIWNQSNKSSPSPEIIDIFINYMYEKFYQHVCIFGSGTNQIQTHIFEFSRSSNQAWDVSLAKNAVCGGYQIRRLFNYTITQQYIIFKAFMQSSSE